jgi:hypothetical protein
VRIGALGLTCFRPYPLEEIRAALQGAQRVVVLEKAFAVGLGGIAGQNVRLALSGHAVSVYDTVAGLGGRPITRRTLRTLIADVLEERLEPDRLAFLDLDWKLVERELQRVSADPRSGPHAENILRDIGSVAASAHGGGPMSAEKLKLYQVGTFAVGNRLLDPEQRTVQARMERSNTLTSGHRACRGCGEALGARYALDAAMRATDGRLIAANATGCLEVFSTPYPESSWQLPWLHSLFGNAPAIASGIAAAPEGQGPKRRTRHRSGRRRGHARHRIRVSSPGCSSETTTCSTSATTTRRT